MDESERLTDVELDPEGLAGECRMLLGVWRKIGLIKYEVSRNYGHLDPCAAAADVRDADIYFRLAQRLEDAVDRAAEPPGEKLNSDQPTSSSGPDAPP